MDTISIAIERKTPVRTGLIIGLLFGVVLAASGMTQLPWVRSELLPQTETAKLLYLMQRYQHKGFQIILDGNSYDSRVAFEKARRALIGYYQGEEAKVWIGKYLYRSPEKRKIIYLSFPNGVRRPLRDVLLEDLFRLQERLSQFRK